MAREPDPELLRAACRLALDVARRDETAVPPVPAPAGVRNLLRFVRLSATAHDQVRRTIEADGEFRARVAAAAGPVDDPLVGRAGWLWLHRPAGWSEDPALTPDEAPSTRSAGDASPARLRRERDAADAAAVKYRERSETARRDQRRTAQELAAATARSVQLAASLAELERDRDQLATERRRAVRDLKAAEARLTEVRTDLNAARRATVEAEAELAAVRAGDGPVPADDPAVVVPGPSPEVRSALQRAAEAAAVLNEALSTASDALDVHPGSAPEDRLGAAARGRANRRRRSSSRRVRRRPELPPGLLAGSPEADRHLVSGSGATVVVDGYNLARTAWSRSEPRDERRRTVALLEEAAARWGTTIIVVFDGVDDAASPAASRFVAVRYSSTGQTADAYIAAWLHEAASDRPVVVVSTDREVVEDAEVQGAGTLSSAAFLTAVGR